MKQSALYSAILFSTVPCSMLYAGGLDRSGQPISAFLQPGNYAEVNISVLDATVKGQDLKGVATGDMAEDYYSPQAAIKIQATDHISIGLLYDQPYGANTQYKGKNDFVASNTDVISKNPQTGNNVTTGQIQQLTGVSVEGGTSVEVNTQTLSLLLGYQPNENWNIYAGPVYQTVEGIVKLRGETYSVLNGYNLKTDVNGDWGWLAGVAYQIPEIAFKAALTYRSEVEHKMYAHEAAPYASLISTPVITPSTFSFSTPQSVNLDLQTGIMQNTIAFANLRWVDWSHFTVRPTAFSKITNTIGMIKPEINKPNGFNLIDYKDNQISVNAGVARRFNDKWAANVSVGWDSGAGNPVTTLGPVDGYWSLGTGVRYNPQKDYFIGAGVKYFWLGDADAVTGAHTPAGNFKDNHAIGYGLSMGYSF